MNCFLKLFGGASLKCDRAAIIGGTMQRHRIALLAVLATSPGRFLSRDKLTALLWPERDQEHARNLLNQAVYVLRRALGDEVILSAPDGLRLNIAVVHCDVTEFEAALAREDLKGAVRLYDGPFFDGFFLSDSQEFEVWTDRKRDRLASAYADALERLAEDSEERGNVREAADWWKALAEHDPYNSQTVLRLVKALEASGNPGGALRHAAQHNRLLQEELGIHAAEEVIKWADMIRNRSSHNDINPR